MGGKSSPPPPDYAAAAQQQGAANQSTALQQSVLNNPNMVTPYGSQQYSPLTQTGTDAQGNPIYARQTLTQTLSPEQQAILSGGEQAQQTSLNILNQDAPNIQNALLKPFGSSTPVTQGGYLPGTGPTQGIQYTPGNAGAIQGNINMNGVQPVPVANSPFMNNVVNATYQEGAQFLDPQFAQARSDLTGQLANQGITPGSDAYNRAVNNLALQQQGAYTDLRNQATTQGQSAAQGLYGMQLSGNQAGFGESQAQGQFANTAQQQQFQQLLDAMNSRNSAVGTQAQIASNQTGLANQEQQQQYTQDVTNRTLPINMINSLLSSSQVQNPTFQATQPTAIAPPPIMQGAGLQGQANAAQSSANAGKMGSGLGAIGTIGGAAMMAL